MRRLTCYLLVPCLAILALLPWISPRRVAAQAQASDTLVIEGGTLIDGKGGAPVPDAVVVIQGNKITTVSRKGQASYPPTAQVIHADGKFILPGYWEAESVWKWYIGEAEFNYGVTTVSDIGEGGELMRLQHDAVNRGKLNGPRIFTGIARIGTLGFDDPQRVPTGVKSPFDPGLVPTSAEDARVIARRMLSAGADLVNFQSGQFPVEYYRAAIDEAHKAGKPVFIRPSGPIFNLPDAIPMDPDIVSHSDGIPIAIAKDPSKFSGGVSVTGLDAAVGKAAVGGTSYSVNELDVYADMDDAKEAALIKSMVDHKIALAPTLIRKGAGFHKENAEFLAETRDWWLSNQPLQAYYPEEMFQSELLEMTPQEMPPALWKERERGYQNLLRFHGDFVRAGGRMMAGCNAPFIRPPGLCLHQELQLFADAGLTPMQVIQAATIWPAQTFRVADKVGSIEVGKLGDVVILDADPLQDIKNMRKVNTVIYDGKVQKLGYHADFALSQPYRIGAGLDMNLIVDDSGWVASIKQALGTSLEGQPLATAPPGGPVRVNPPAIESISPNVVKQGSTDATLTIKGYNFFSRCLVYVNNVIVGYRLVSPNELEVILDPSLLQQPGVLDIQIKQPGPLFNQQGYHARDGLSNKAHLLVNFNY